MLIVESAGCTIENSLLSPCKETESVKVEIKVEVAKVGTGVGTSVVVGASSSTTSGPVLTVGV